MSMRTQQLAMQPRTDNILASNACVDTFLRTSLAFATSLPKQVHDTTPQQQPYCMMHPAFTYFLLGLLPSRQCHHNIGFSAVL